MAYHYFCTTVVNKDNNGLPFCKASDILGKRSRETLINTILKTAGIICLFSCLVHLPFISFGQEWSVSPIRLDLTARTASGVITVSNDSANKISYQMKAFLWTQDEAGKDQYVETTDLIFFPKMMVVEQNDQKVIRVGTKTPRSDTEKAYRLFIEDISRPQATGGASVVFAIRFGVPIFFKPLKEEYKGAIEKAAMEKGVLSVAIRNTGNSHFVIQKIAVKGVGPNNEAVFSRDLPGWYLLSGVAKSHTTEIPEESCKKIAKIEIEAKTDRFTLKDSLNVKRTMCHR